MVIRVVSLNCWGGRVHGPLMNFIAGANADIFCLQEVYDAPREVPLELVFPASTREDPVRPQLFREIQALLPEHHGIFCPSTQGHLHDGASVNENIRYGIATFVHERLPIIEQKSRFVYEWYRPRGWGNPPLPRTAHAIKVWDYGSEGPVTLAHMHGMWIPGGKIDTAEGRTQAWKFLHLIKEVASPGDKLIACGDFNILPDSEFFGFASSEGLEDLVKDADTRTSFYKKSSVRHADYMLVSSRVQVSNLDIPAQPEVSDHRPLVLDFE